MTQRALAPDGFGGARDAQILETYGDDWKSGDPIPEIVRVQAVKRTKDLLHRAGFKRVITHNFYPVKVRHDEKSNRLQLA